MTETPDFRYEPTTRCGDRFRTRREPGCGALIRWVTLNGKPHPIDPKPVENGNLLLVNRETVDPGFSEPAELVMIAKAQRETHKGRLYISHFATCPVAERFRNRK